MVGAAGDLLVDREADAHRRMLELRAPLQVRDRSHDLGDARLVVGAEQRRAVSRDDVVSDLLLQQRQLCRDRARHPGRPGSSITPPS